jgi:hypothetical protein
MRPTAYRRNARGLRDRQAFEGVRMQAGALFAAGHARLVFLGRYLLDWFRIVRESTSTLKATCQ